MLGLLACLVGCGRSSALPASERQPVVAPSVDTPAQTAVAAPSAVPAAQAAPGIPVKWWSGLELRSLAEAKHVYGDDAADSFGPLKRGGTTRQPRNCVEWTQLSAEGYEPVDGLAAQTDDGAKLRCMTLLLLQRAQPSKTSYVRELAWDATLLPLLPAAVATAFNEQRKRAVERATARQESLAKLDPRAHAGRKQEDTLEVIEGGGQTMILLHAEAWGDLDADGIEDLVLSVTNGATQGTYSYARLLVLTRSSASEPLRLISVE
jgi:hypothetical protein